MKRTAFALSLALLGAPASVSAAEATCPELGGRMSAGEIDRHYALRVIGIVRAALRHDRAELAGKVSPQASYSIGSGDTIIGARTGSGVEAVIAFASWLQPTHYQIETPVDGPITVKAVVCKWTTKLLLVGNDNAVRLRAQFADDRLIGIEGQTVWLAEGALNEAPPASP